jgi:hypothetical protein
LFCVTLRKLEHLTLKLELFPAKFILKLLLLCLHFVLLKARFIVFNPEINELVLNFSDDSFTLRLKLLLNLFKLIL